jgi:hypothetical protein
MRKTFQALFILLVVTLSGCANDYALMRDSNRSALNRIDVGMSKAQVQEIMGIKVADDGRTGRFENPYKREFEKGLDGKSYEVLYYYTQQIGNNPIESGLTPITFLNGKVVGIGWGFLDNTVGNPTATIRRR